MCKTLLSLQLDSLQPYIRTRTYVVTPPHNPPSESHCGQRRESQSSACSTPSCRCGWRTRITALMGMAGAAAPLLTAQIARTTALAMGDRWSERCVDLVQYSSNEDLIPSKFTLTLMQSAEYEPDALGSNVAHTNNCTCPHPRQAQALGTIHFRVLGNVATRPQRTHLPCSSSER